jgi:hypothetical protein
MATGPIHFSEKLLEISNVPPALPVRPAQPMRDAFESPQRVGARRGPPEARGPKWPYEDWPLPFASFWTSALMMGLSYPVQSLYATLVALLAGVWLGVRVDRWLRRHPAVGGRRLRFLAGVSSQPTG